MTADSVKGDGEKRLGFSLDLRIPVVWLMGLGAFTIGQTVVWTQLIDGMDKRLTEEETYTKQLKGEDLPKRLVRIETLQETLPETLNERFGGQDDRLRRIEEKLDRVIEAKSRNGSR
jgi:hypothetical protein